VTMNTPRWIPSPSQLLLLKAGLLTKEEAIEAWETYISTHNPQTVDHLSTSFFPLVYRNLRKGDSRELLTCKSAYKHTWCHNQEVLYTFHKAIQDIALPVTLLKGAALLPYYYRDLGIRVLGDIDILVQQDDARKIITRLLSKGWQIVDTMHGATLEQFIRRTHAIMLKDAKERRIDIHWKILGNSGLDTVLNRYTPRFQSTEDGFTILSAEDQLIHTLYHGIEFSPIPILRWIPDAVTCITKMSDFDWDYFSWQAGRLKLTYLLSQPLQFLIRSKLCSIPDWVAGVTPLQFDSSFFKYHTEKKASLLKTLQGYFLGNVRNQNTPNLFLSFFTLHRYIMKRKGFTKKRSLMPFLIRALFLSFVRKKPIPKSYFPHRQK